MKKGTYYIGDPGYVFDESWEDFLEETEYCEDGIYEYTGEMVCVGKTAYGDGAYYDMQRRRYAVDSGSLGILPVSLLEMDNIETVESIKSKCFSHIVEMKEDFDCNVKNGVFRFGNIVIDTKDDGEE
ncbi:MAG: hypothetical protein AB1401_00595 [Thermodesulfobacteriota bacterium]